MTLSFVHHALHSSTRALFPGPRISPNYVRIPFYPTHPTRLNNCPCASQSSTQPQPPPLLDPTPEKNPKPTTIQLLRPTLPLLLSLLFVYISNQWSRNILIYTVNFASTTPPPSPFQYINTALNFTASDYALLASFGFTALYSIVSVFSGPFIDRTPKQNVIFLATLLWSFATFATGCPYTTNTFRDAFTWRVVQGVAQAVTGPASYALIGEVVPEKVRATAASIYASGVYLGGGLASFTVLLAKQYGWRGAFMIVGTWGALVASIFTFLFQITGKSDYRPQIQNIQQPPNLDPLQTSQHSPTQTTPRTPFKTILACTPVRWLFLATTFRFMAGYMIGLWCAPLLQSTFPEQATSFALINAAIVSGAGFLSSVGGGILADSLVSSKAPKNSLLKNRPALAQLTVPVLGSLLAIPAWTLVCRAGSFNVAMGALFVEYLVAECWFGPTISVMQKALPKEVHATAQGCFTALALLGNVAPWIAGLAISAGWAQQDVVGVGVAIPYLLAALTFIKTSISADAQRHEHL